ncbi:hypothetical protein [Sinomicrobium oceani]|nr:hypothetical protein [Sinomicrobium oceani]
MKYCDTNHVFSGILLVVLASFFSCKKGPGQESVPEDVARRREVYLAGL